jgi:uncharacterized peroxidase-related enzyme
MTFIQTVPVEGAQGDAAQLYEADREAFGYVPNFTQAFSERPAIYMAWRQLNGAIKQTMDLRRYELVTLAAAAKLRSSYCCLAHGSVLADQFLPAEAVQVLVADHRAGGLSEQEVAVMDLAERVVEDATQIEPGHLDRLRELGLSDGEIVEVVAAASARCFFSKTLDALGTEPDAKFNDLEPRLRDALTVGRPIQRA